MSIISRLSILRITYYCRLPLAFCLQAVGAGTASERAHAISKGILSVIASAPPRMETSHKSRGQTKPYPVLFAAAASNAADFAVTWAN